MNLEGAKMETISKLRADSFHHTHEVSGPCTYKNTPLRELVGRVRQSSGGFVVLFAPFPGEMWSNRGEKHKSGYNGKREETCKNLDFGFVHVPRSK